MGYIVKEVYFEGSRGSGKFRTLFDTGAGVSVVKKSVAEKLGRPEKLPRPLEMTTADKNHKIYSYERVSLDFWLEEDDRLSDEFFVLQDELMEEDVIVGAGTMQKWRLVIDMEKEKVYSTREMKKIRL